MPKSIRPKTKTSDVKPKVPAVWRVLRDRASRLASPFFLDRRGLGALCQSRDVCRQTIGLAVKSSFFSAGRALDAHSHRRCCGDFEYVLSHEPAAFRNFVKRVLASPRSFDPRPVWALYWAMVAAEHEFLYRFIPFWSNEERLTGHLVSQICERAIQARADWSTLAKSHDDATSACEIQYADTAAARQEAHTGADFALIVHGRFPKSEEFFKVARFQAKKVLPNGTAAIDLSQVAALLKGRKQKNLGFYVFYHPLRQDWTLAPTVRSATAFEGALKRKAGEGTPAKSSAPTLKVANEGWDFATFVTFALCDPASEHGLRAENPSAAARAAMAGNVGFPSPSRVFVVTLGGGSLDWPDLLGHAQDARLTYTEDALEGEDEEGE